MHIEENRAGKRYQEMARLFLFSVLKNFIISFSSTLDRAEACLSSSPV